MKDTTKLEDDYQELVDSLYIAKVELENYKRAYYANFGGTILRIIADLGPDGCSLAEISSEMNARGNKELPISSWAWTLDELQGDNLINVTRTDKGVSCAVTTEGLKLLYIITLCYS